MQGFDEFFLAATGHSPHGYQRRLASDGLPAVVAAPTGTGKTGIVVAWLWRRRQYPGITPRRLIFALPQRSLVEQVADDVRTWLANLKRAESAAESPAQSPVGDVSLHVVMGSVARDEQRQWRLDMHRPAIVVGTVDSLVSKALNRGYGISRASFPIDFALVTNGAHWIVDEVQLCGESTTTLRQLAAFTREYQTAEPFGLTCMSATVPHGLLETADNPGRGNVITIVPEERTGELGTRLNAKRTVRRLDVTPGDYKAIARKASAAHREGTLTLVVVNTVGAARGIHKHIPEAMLLHPGFRGRERQKLVEELPGAGIVVATQVVEAGIDLNASVMITEAAPWPSLVRRAGRCNRTGTVRSAELWWVAPETHLPYERADIEATKGELERLEGEALTGEALLARDVQVTPGRVAVIRRPDLLDLFDTSPDTSGNDIDVARYVRDAGDLDALVAWATWTPAAGTRAPLPDVRPPQAEYRCRVPVGEANRLARIMPVWGFDHVLGEWSRVAGSARPGEIFLVDAADGGYDPVTGFDPSAKGPVPDSPRLMTREEIAAAADEGSGQEPTSTGPRPQTLDEHSRDVRDEAKKLLAAVTPALTEGVAATVVTAAYLHDAGKAHEIWQGAIRALMDPEGNEENGPWAKSGTDGRLEFAGGVAFRHELASLLLLDTDGPLGHLLDETPDADLARYLVLAHHGKLRVQVRDDGDLALAEARTEGGGAGDMILGLRNGATTDVPSMLGQPATRLTVNLDRFRCGSDRSWARTVLGLRDKYGPFVLAYLETVVRVADWRASAALEDRR